MFAAAGLLDALGLACDSLSAALEQQQQQLSHAVYSLSHGCLTLWHEWPVNASKVDPGSSAGSEQLCSGRLDTAKHALLLAEASSPAAVLPAVARLTMALLRIGVPGGVSSSSSSSSSIAGSSSSQQSRHGSSSSSSSSSASCPGLGAVGHGRTRQAVYDVAASIACISARIAASFSIPLDMFSTGALHDVLLLELALNVQAAHQKQHGRTQLPKVSAAVSAAMQRSGFHPGQQQQQQQQQGASRIEPLHEQLLLALGVPPEELKLAAGLTVRRSMAKYADGYSTKSAVDVLCALANAVSADAGTVATMTQEASEQLDSSSRDWQSGDQHPAVAANLGCCDRLLAPPVISSLLELLLLACSSTSSKGRARQQTGSLGAQAAAAYARAEGSQAAGLADAVLVNFIARAAFAREVDAFSIDIKAQLAASAASGDADDDLDVVSIAIATRRRHQAAAAPGMRVTALLGPLLQIGPALLHLERQCSADAAAAAGCDDPDGVTTPVQSGRSLMFKYGSIMCELASAQSGPTGKLAVLLLQKSMHCHVCRLTRCHHSLLRSSTGVQQASHVASCYHALCTSYAICVTQSYAEVRFSLAASRRDGGYQELAL
jgi:hypothetical protein